MPLVDIQPLTHADSTPCSMELNPDLDETTADQGELGESLTDGGVSVRHQDDHGDGAGVDDALVGGLQQHLHRLHQRLVDVGS